MDSRSKTIEWQDPMVGASRALTMTGLDYMLAMRDGLVPPPPISAGMNMSLVDVEPGRAVFTAVPDESHYNPIGRVHGGFACTVLDSVAGCAVHATLPAGFGYTSLEIKVNYLAGISVDSGTLTATGTVTKPGKRVAFAEAVLADAAGRVLATASSTLLVFPVLGQA